MALRTPSYRLLDWREQQTSQCGSLRGDLLLCSSPAERPIISREKISLVSSANSHLHFSDGYLEGCICTEKTLIELYDQDLDHGAWYERFCQSTGLRKTLFWCPFRVHYAVRLVVQLSAVHRPNTDDKEAFDQQKSPTSSSAGIQLLVECAYYGYSVLDDSAVRYPWC